MSIAVDELEGCSSSRVHKSRKDSPELKNDKPNYMNTVEY
jgi:hypothetical protein